MTSNALPDRLHTWHFRREVGIQIPIPYPDDPPRSLETQHRIVARIEALFGELRECRKLHQAVVEDTKPAAGGGVGGGVRYYGNSKLAFRDRTVRSC